MLTVGVRELKNRLSAFLRRVRSGESVLVTDRGEVVAEISPPGQKVSDASVPAGLLLLARRGVATLGSRSEPGAYPALPRARRRGRSAAQLLEEERGSR
jgi:antitoxin (DNA-binding transcriptional repressor) of toxin-antitoxin stability system